MSGDSQYNEQYTSTIDDTLIEAQGHSKEHATDGQEKHGELPWNVLISGFCRHDREIIWEQSYNARCLKEGDR